MENYTDLIILTASNKFGITAVKPYQLLVIQRILEQTESDYVRHQVIILPTGTGKSLCFQIPASLCEKKTIIVYPLLALMTDQKNRMEQAGISTVVLRGGQTKEQRKNLFKQLQDGAKVVITNPETLCQNKVLKMLTGFKFELFVVDEAHVIEQWGKDFRPEYSKLKSVLSFLSPHQILAFTATASPTTLYTIERSLFTEKPLVIQGDSDRENIFYSALVSPSSDLGTLEVLKICPKPALVFCGQRKNTEILCLKTKKEIPDLPCRYYHAGLSKQEREAIETWFMQSQDGVLFSTCAFGMGIDKNGIRTVLHYAIPRTVEEYLQESGRAGRDGEQAWAITIITPNTDKSNRVAQIFMNQNCRRQELLKALGQDKEECTGCDICTGKTLSLAYVKDEIIRLIRTSPLRYTYQSATALLTGSRIKWRTFSKSHYHPMYGILSEYSYEEVLSIIKSSNEIHSFRDRLYYKT